MAWPEPPQNRIPGRSGRDQQHHQKAVNAGAANGPVSVPRGQPLPDSGGGSTGGGKAPTSMVSIVRDQTPVSRDAILVSAPIVEGLKMGVIHLRDVAKNTRMNFTSTGTSPTA